MNLIERSKQMSLSGIHVGSRITILNQTPAEFYSRKIIFETGKIYEVSGVKKCSGLFSCSENCMTNCISYQVDVFKEDGTKITTCTCECVLGNTLGHPLVKEK